MLDPRQAPRSSAPLTLVVDLDGTLTPTDTLVESVLLLARQAPLALFKLPLWLARGREVMKTEIARRITLAPEQLPWREDLLDYLRAQKAAGRRLVLATAAHQSIADGVARHLGLFDAVLATDGTRNLKGGNKLAAIRAAVGPDFTYAGDSVADLPVWEGARAAVLVGASSAVARSVRGKHTVEKEFARPVAGLATWRKALRVHQWAKNLLLFVPLLTAFSFLPADIATMLLAFLCFSLAASATYIANDLWDLGNDRLHPRKRQRPFASGALPIISGVAAAALLLIGAFGLAFMVNTGFVAMLLAYVVLTTAYSWWLKEKVLVDVLVLAMLYTMRIVTGSVAVGIHTTSWLLAFSLFVFLSLALVKRCSELQLLQQRGHASAHGRDYRVVDLAVLWPMGLASALAAVVVLGLFINAPDTAQRYASPMLLWGLAALMIYWLGRLWIKTARGEMDDDPVLYALKDRGSRLVVAAMVLVAVCAHFIDLTALLS
ncbi:UbiA family prenyltransferase [Massilia yuzhufengensis]|uniref:4-hydroxybenzoate polyprenyltransferase n=1 Tax=Massilia yuzhufengensis TaxID=1164594 RepID=A0A1I1DFB8_9BURK|nr:UbiA family prenyltransferase [Massilia yuzhufengensis]SFB73066.1 4-hydroxybenzoate polyprenyltransferase [Massilia yuzhufengensis]